MKPVIVTAKDGMVVHQAPNNPEYGYVRVTQEKHKFEDGFGKVVVESALVSGKLADLISFEWKEGDHLPGQIVTKESFDPPVSDARYQDKYLKIAYPTNVVCTNQGRPIYRRNYYTTDLGDSDLLLPHDNKAEIKEAQARLEEADSAIAANQDFDV